MSMSTSLSQGIGKHTNGKSRVNAEVADITTRSHTRRHASVGSAYTVVNSGGLIKIEFSQTGNRQDVTRHVLVGEVTANGYKSYSALSCDGVQLSWDEVAVLIGANPDRLMASVLKFAKSQKCVEAKSSRDRYVSRVENRHKRDRTKTSMKGIRIC